MGDFSNLSKSFVRQRRLHATQSNTDASAIDNNDEAKQVDEMTLPANAALRSQALP